MLQFRIATVEDRKPMGQPKRSRFLWKSDLLGVKSDVRKVRTLSCKLSVAWRENDVPEA